MCLPGKWTLTIPFGSNPKHSILPNKSRRTEELERVSVEKSKGI